MTQPPKVVRSKRLETQLKTEVITKDEFEVVYQDKQNYWDQLRALLNQQGWTTHDHATLNLVSEMPNFHAFFAVRKINNAVIGAINFIDTPNFVYGNFYIVRAEYHAAGVGALLMRTMLTRLAPQLKSKGFVSRAGRAVYKVYVSWPTNAIYLYNVWSVKITGFDDLRQIFPLNKAHSYHVATMKDVLKDHKMMTAVEKYDQFVTGQERSHFLRNYYSIDYVQVFLMHLIAQKANHPNPVFLIHVRTKTAGDWILNKCKEVGRPLISRGCTITLPAYPLYKDRAKTQFMYAPTNSPAHFDG